MTTETVAAASTRGAARPVRSLGRKAACASTSAAKMLLRLVKKPRKCHNAMSAGPPRAWALSSVSARWRLTATAPRQVTEIAVDRAAFSCMRMSRRCVGPARA